MMGFRSAGGAALVDLPDLAYGHPMAIHAGVIKMLSHCIVYGPGDLLSCFAVVRSLAPVFGHSHLERVDGFDEENQWITRLPNSNAAWTAIEGSAGSAIYTAFPNRQDTAELMIRDADMPLERGVRRPWAHVDVKPNHPFPADFVNILCNATVRPAWTIPALAHLRPDSAIASAPAPLTAPPAWYPNPDGNPGVRWWDGDRWTEHCRT